eukprot:jgi/Tetstr1/429325/TSEL_019243.t1
MPRLAAVRAAAPLGGSISTSRLPTAPAAPARVPPAVRRPTLEPTHGSRQGTSRSQVGSVVPRASGSNGGGPQWFAPFERFYSEAELRSDSWKACRRPTRQQADCTARRSGPSILQPPSPLAPLLKARNLLPAAVILATLVGLLLPQTFQQFPTKLFVPGMAYVAFVVGLDLSPRSIARVFRRLQDVALGVVLQWTVLPAVSVLLALFAVPALGLPADIGDGLQLAACVPGAILSNYAVWVAQPQMAPLAVVLSTLSMLSGILLTPLLVHVLLGQTVAVDRAGMLIATGQLIVAPVAAGMMLSALLPRLISKLKPLLSLLALVDVCFCVGVSTSVNGGLLASDWGRWAALLVLALHSSAFFVSYFISRRLLNSPARAKCISIATGMQSALLACFLSTKFFHSEAATLPCSLSVTIMLLMGLALAQVWRPAR